MTSEVRWHQRLNSFNTALKQLEDGVAISRQRQLSPLEEQGLIQAFEYNFELAWNVIKDFYGSQGETDIQGSRDAFRLAFKRGLIQQGDIWMGMIKSRIQTSHTYNEKTAKEVIDKIKCQYLKEFLTLSSTLELKK
ncbi:nucleotidyltransferase substrate binding protein [Candidatus Colwellia aromaticivorans]|uniref:nucleotidyltransferase substrate binding protein n=1 Tax=Candidatus Colwellia aromaticivorans TaxID=2267621 RepID=UPI000DF13710|nr:nucleotidyltransferase substrate binding protein [Candidatus Colwellia aromaticivorans]